jgi:dTDP-glucose pyrophosphorylase
MSRALLAKICVQADRPVSDAVACIEASGGEIALVVDSRGRLIGTVTDGDVRRGILSGILLDAPVSQVMNGAPKFVVGRVDLDRLADDMQAASIAQMPVVDDQGVVQDIILAKDLRRPHLADHPVVIMAGGLGTRLRPITETLPKPMIPIGGRPILELIIERFRDQGFRNITLCVNHLAEVIRDHFGAGHDFGVSIDYVQETKRLGTAGALSLVSPSPAMPTIVMNGDILTAVNFSQLIKFHQENRALATMGLNRFQYALPYGVVEVAGSKIRSFREKPVFDFFVNAGIYVVNPEVIEMIPPDTYFDMPTLFERLSESQRVAFPIHEYWLDIGRPDDLERAIRENQRPDAT